MKTTLSIAAVIGVLGLGSLASARYAGGTGTASDPFVIATAAHLNEIGTYPDDWDKHFILINDIDLSGYKDTQFNVIGGWHQDVAAEEQAVPRRLRWARTQDSQLHLDFQRRGLRGPVQGHPGSPDQERGNGERRYKDDRRRMCRRAGGSE